MNLKTVKAVAASAIVAASAAVGFPASAGTLPAEYQRVEYIESAGASITLTGFKATSDMTIWIRSSFAQWSGACFLGDGNCRFFGANSPTAYYYDHGSANRSSVGGLVANDVREFELGKSYIADRATGKVIAGTKGGGSDFADHTGDMALFASGDYGRCYYLRVFRETEGVRWMAHDYVPCYEKSTEAVGLYDTVEGTFLTNSSGSLTAGPDLTAFDRAIVLFGAGGTASGPARANSGTTVTLTATPEEGCRFSRWTVEGECVTPVGSLASPTLELEVGDDPMPIVVRAGFVPADADGNVIRNGSFEEGNTLTSTYGSATARDWTSNGGKYAKAGSPFIASQTMDGTFAALADKTCTAHEQTFVAPAGEWTLSLNVASRGGSYTKHRLTALIDGTEVLNEVTENTIFSPVSAPVTLAATPGDLHTIVFKGSLNGKSDCASSFDVVRLVTESSASNTLVVAATQVLDADFAPALGTYHGLAAGDVIVCTAPELTTVGDDDYTCTGWKLYDWDESVQAFADQPSSTGTGASAEIVFGTVSQKLVWQIVKASSLDVPPSISALDVMWIEATNGLLSVTLGECGAKSGGEYSPSCALSVRLRPSGGGWGEPVEVAPAVATGETVEVPLAFLEQETSYEVEVSAVNTFGMSGTRTQTFTTQESRPPCVTVSIAAVAEFGEPSPDYGETALAAGVERIFAGPAAMPLLDGSVTRTVTGYTLGVTTYSGASSNVVGTTDSFAFTPRNGDVLTLVWRTEDVISKAEMPYTLYTPTGDFETYWVLINGDLTDSLYTYSTICADLGAPHHVPYLACAPRPTLAERCKFTLFGSNDNATWTELMKQTEILPDRALTAVPTGTSEAYRYFKLTDIGYGNISELRFYSDDVIVRLDRAEPWATEATGAADHPDGVLVSGQLVHAPGGTAAVFAYVAPRDCGADLGQWAACGVRTDLGTYANGEAFSGRLAGLGRGCWYCRVFAQDGANVSASQTTRSFMVGTAVELPPLYTTVADMHKSYDGNTGVFPDIGSNGDWTFDLRGINARHRRLVGLRLWLRTEGDEAFRRLFGAQVYVSYDEADWSSVVVSSSSDGAGRVRNVVSALPGSLNWVKVANFHDRQYQIGARYAIEELVLPKLRRKPTHIRITGVERSNIKEFDLRSDLDRGFLIEIR